MTDTPTDPQDALAEAIESVAVVIRRDLNIGEINETDLDRLIAAARAWHRHTTQAGGGIKAEQIVLNELGQDWKLKWTDSGGGLCVHKHKEIWVDKKYKNSLGMILHEIAHVKYPEHDVYFADHFTALVDKYTALKQPETQGVEEDTRCSPHPLNNLDER